MSQLGDLHADQDVAVAIGTRGTLGARPGSPYVANRMYEATDVGVVYRDTGAAWVAVGFIPLAPDTLGNRPSPAVAGREYEASDVGVVYRDTGAAWVPVAFLPKADTFAKRPASGVDGRMFRATDTHTLYRDNGSEWEPVGAAPGDLKLAAGTATPAGWAKPEGQEVTRTGVYAALFAEIGTTHGAGNGTTTFNLPDYRERAPIGPGGTLAIGAKGGAATHTLALGQMPKHGHPDSGHAHTATDSGHGHSGSTSMTNVINTAAAGPPWIRIQDVAGMNLVYVGSIPITIGAGAANITVASAKANLAEAGSGEAHNNMQPYTVCNMLIKL